jgi:hypothetical protein
MTNLSTKGIQALINWETSGEEYYKKNPIWPGEQSGVTIGVGWIWDRRRPLRLAGLGRLI